MMDVSVKTPKGEHVSCTSLENPGRDVGAPYLSSLVMELTRSKSQLVISASISNSILLMYSLKAMPH